MRVIFAAAMVLSIAGCGYSGGAPLMSTLDPTTLQAIQTRSFATGDRLGTMRTTMATLQDLGYSIEKADLQTGTIAATKFDVSLTASVLPGAGSATIVRADALVSLDGRPYQVDEPLFYKNNFFLPLSQRLALEPVPAAGAPYVSEPAYTVPTSSGSDVDPSAPWAATPSP